MLIRSSLPTHLAGDLIWASPTTSSLPPMIAVAARRASRGL